MQNYNNYVKMVYPAPVKGVFQVSESGEKHRNYNIDGIFKSLDPSTQIRLIRMLNDLMRERTVTVLVSSHDLNHVTEVCKRIVVLENGIVVHDLKKSDTTLEELEKYFAV